MSALAAQIPTTAPADIMAEARANCAARYRSRGQELEAGAFEIGERDQAWAMRHEVNKITAERAVQPLAEGAA